MNLGVISTELICTTMRSHKITKGIHIDRKLKESRGWEGWKVKESRRGRQGEERKEDRRLRN